jgi:hypothetical protein
MTIVAAAPKAGGGGAAAAPFAFAFCFEPQHANIGMFRAAAPSCRAARSPRDPPPAPLREGVRRA